MTVSADVAEGASKLLDKTLRDRAAGLLSGRTDVPSIIGPNIDWLSDELGGVDKLIVSRLFKAAIIAEVEARFEAYDASIAKGKDLVDEVRTTLGRQPGIRVP